MEEESGFERKVRRQEREEQAQSGTETDLLASGDLCVGDGDDTARETREDTDSGLCLVPPTPPNFPSHRNIKYSK